MSNGMKGEKMIEYLYTEGQEPCENEPLKVRLDGRRYGEIRKVKGGYQYFPNPKGSKKDDGGEIFSSVTKVQESLAI